MKQLVELYAWAYELKQRDDLRSKNQARAIRNVAVRFEKAAWRRSLRGQLEKLSKWMDTLNTDYDGNINKISQIHIVSLRMAKKRKH